MLKFISHYTFFPKFTYNITVLVKYFVCICFILIFLCILALLKLRNGFNDLSNKFVLLTLIQGRKKSNKYKIGISKGLAGKLKKQNCLFYKGGIGTSD